MKRDPLRWLGWIGLGLRVLFGAGFGAMVGFLFVPRLVWLRHVSTGLAIMAAGAVIFGYLCGRYGQEVWLNLRDGSDSD